jgi:hypothetical protein
MYSPVQLLYTNKKFFEKRREWLRENDGGGKSYQDTL